MSDLLQEAIAGLHINVPIYRTVENDGLLILYLYGGRVVRWPPSKMATDLPSGSRDPVTTPPPDDLTKIPGIGKATAAALNNAGFNTFQDLHQADDHAILAVPKLTAYALAKIRSYLYIHHP